MWAKIKLVNSITSVMLLDFHGPWVTGLRAFHCIHLTATFMIVNQFISTSPAKLDFLGRFSTTFSVSC